MVNKKRPLAHWGWRTPLSKPYYLEAGGKRRCSPIFSIRTPVGSPYLGRSYTVKLKSCQWLSLFEQNSERERRDGREAGEARRAGLDAEREIVTQPDDHKG